MRAVVLTSVVVLGRRSPGGAAGLYPDWEAPPTASRTLRRTASRRKRHREADRADRVAKEGLTVQRCHA